jgi:hypothetical protein
VAENWDFTAAAFRNRGTPLPGGISAWKKELVGSLPLGAQRQVAFAVALSHRPELQPRGGSRGDRRTVGRGMNRTGRRPGTPDTRDAILAAARRRFATRGYDATSVRAIATEAEVDPALVIHYFGTKEALFTTAAGLPPAFPMLIASLGTVPLQDFGQALARGCSPSSRGSPATRTIAISPVQGDRLL